jgi:hypothetical protein
MARFHLTDTVDVEGIGPVHVSTIQLETVTRDCHGAVTVVLSDSYETCLFWQGTASSVPGMANRVDKGSRVVESYGVESDAISGHVGWSIAENIANVLEDVMPAPATVRETLVDAYGVESLKASSYVYEIVNSYRTNGEDVLVMSHAVANDIHGYDDAVSVSNYETLRDSWSQLEAWFDSTYSNADYAGLRLDATAPEDLIDVLDALENYPVLDDSRHSDVEQRMIVEHYESYGRSDVLDTVAKAIGYDSGDLTDTARDMIDRLVWDGLVPYGYSDGYPMFIDSSAVEFGADEIAEYVKANVGNANVRIQHYAYEPEYVEFDMRLETLIEPYALEA